MRIPKETLPMTVIVAGLGVQGAMEETRRLHDDLEKAVQVPCRDALTNGSQDFLPGLDDPPRGTPVHVSGGLSHAGRASGTPVITPAKNRSA